MLNMALHTLKESPGRISRRGLSPTRPSGVSQIASTKSFTSKFLAALDAEMETLTLEVALPSNVSMGKPASKGSTQKISIKPKPTPISTMLTEPKPIHPMFIKEATPRRDESTKATQPLLKSRVKTSKSKGQNKASSSATVSNESFEVPSMAQLEDPQFLYAYDDYKPRPIVHYIRTVAEADEKVQILQGPLGFDLEWVMNFRKGSAPTSRSTALLQLSDTKNILLIQLSAMNKEFPPKVKELLENPNIVKTGANIRNDGHKLVNDFGVFPENLVELGAFALQADPKFSSFSKRPITALSKMVDRYTGKILDKGKVRTSNWETNPLSASQQLYAANDAHCAVTVYNKLVSIAAKNMIDLTDSSKFSSFLWQDFLAGKLFKSKPMVISRAASSASSSSKKSSGSTCPTWEDVIPGSPKNQHMRAYNCWHHHHMALDDICAALRAKDNPLQRSTVISYVVRAIQADPSLPFSVERLRDLILLESYSWKRHQEWLMIQTGNKVFS